MIRRLLTVLLLAVLASIHLAHAQGSSVNYQGLWWNPSESGWGINFAHQGDTIFATWFTYDRTGKPWWLYGALQRTAAGIYGGDAYTATGPSFDAVPWDKAQAKGTWVGMITARFTTANDGVLSYSINGVSQEKTITRQVFGPLPTCVWGAQTDLTKATNYQDLWWNAPAESESGWGINLTHQGDTIFATWFTYDASRQPWWLISTLTKTGTGVYAGEVLMTTGPAFDAVPFDPAKGSWVKAGTAKLSFANGNSGAFAYTINGVSQTKSITRDVFAAPGTVCSVPAPPPVGTLSLCQVSIDSSGVESCSPGGMFIVGATLTIKKTGYPQPSDLAIGTYRLSARDGNVTISNVTAAAANGVVKPYISGLTEGMTIVPGETVTIKLMSPPTRGAEADEKFEFYANGKVFLSMRVLLTTD